MARLQNNVVLLTLPLLPFSSFFRPLPLLPHHASKMIADLKEAFALFDSRCDGTIVASDIATQMKRLGVDIGMHQAQDLVDCVNLDGTGKIDEPEFIHIMSDRSLDDVGESLESELEEAFIALNQGHQLTVPCLIKVMALMGETISEKHAEHMINFANPDGSGEVVMSQFKQVMMGAEQ